MKKLLTIFFSLFALMSISSQAMAKEDDLWEKTRKGANTAIEWTVEKSRQGWEATRQGAIDVAGWTAEKSEKGWEATKEGVNELRAGVGRQSR